MHYSEYRNSPFDLCIPTSDGLGIYFHRMPTDVYEYKQYPTCKCGRKYVPINKGDKECFYCQFRDTDIRKPTALPTQEVYNKCQFCGVHVSNMLRRKIATCQACAAKREYQRQKLVRLKNKLNIHD